MLAYGANMLPYPAGIRVPAGMLAALPTARSFVGKDILHDQASARAVAAIGCVAALMRAPLLKRQRAQHRSICRGNRDGKQVGDAVWFDVTLTPPLGLALQDDQSRSRVVVEQVRAGGSAAEHNKRYTITDGVYRVPHFIQLGDELLFVNGIRCKTVESAVELITQAAEERGEVDLKFSRNTPGYVTVVFPEDGTAATCSGAETISDAAETANHTVEYKCTDGTCGSCWRKDYSADEIYVLCFDDVKVGGIPSQTVYKESSIFWSERAWKERQNNNPNFDNTEPLILKSCPEDYQEWRKINPIAAAQSDMTVSRFNGALSGLVGGDTENPPESKSRKWGAGRNWTGFD